MCVWGVSGVGVGRHDAREDDGEKTKQNNTTNSLTPNMYSLPLTTTLAAPLLRGGTTLPGGSDTRIHVRCCPS